MSDTIDDLDFVEYTNNYGETSRDIDMEDLKKLLIERCKYLKSQIEEAKKPPRMLQIEKRYEARLEELMRIGNLTEKDLK